MATEERTDAEMAEEHEETTTPPTRKGPAERRDEPPAEADDEKQRLRAALKKANAEAADRRRRLDELEAAEEDRKRASLSETDRMKREKADADRQKAEAERRAEAAEKALMEERLDSAIERRAAVKGFLYPDTAPRLIDRSRVSVDEDTGKPDGKSIDDALDRLLKDKPALAEASPRGGTPPREGPRRPGGRGVDRQAEIEAEVWASGKYV